MKGRRLCTSLTQSSILPARPALCAPADQPQQSFDQFVFGCVHETANEEDCPHRYCLNYFNEADRAGVLIKAQESLHGMIAEDMLA